MNAKRAPSFALLRREPGQSGRKNAPKDARQAQKPHPARRRKAQSPQKTRAAQDAPGNSCLALKPLTLTGPLCSAA